MLLAQGPDTFSTLRRFAGERCVVASAAIYSITAVARRPSNRSPMSCMARQCPTGLHRL